MIVVKARNAQQALPEMMHQLKTHPEVQKRNSRNGVVMQFVQPVTIQYLKPRERVVFWEQRDGNPFFHLFECLWMMAGRNDVAFVQKYSSKIGDFSDDGVTFHGAYGNRWRQHFKASAGDVSPFVDQLKHIANTLRTNPEDRRQVLQMWDATVDGNGREGKDFPCNISSVLNRDHLGRLNMMVSNRSNDIVWGALGANCVHFSFLQEVLAKWIGCEVGQYWQVSANMHAYEWNSAGVLPLSDMAFPSAQHKSRCPYEAETVAPFPIVNVDIATWHQDLGMFLSEGDKAMGYRDPFFRKLCVPLYSAYEAFRDRSDHNRYDSALEKVSMAVDCDWKLACTEWLNRRKDKAAAKKG